MDAVKPIRALIVDDEPLARSSLRVLLEAAPGTLIAGEAGNGLEALEAIQSLKPDLVFLDVQMPELDGFGVIELLEPPLPFVVFVTAYDQYALKAFDANAVDYLLKPYSNDRFAQALAKASQACRSGRGNSLELAGMRAAHRAQQRRFVVKTAGRVVFLKAEEIDWIEASDYYACLHVGDRSYLIRESMNDLEAGLDPAAFLRIHRSAIVNLERVKEILTPLQGDLAVRLKDGTAVRLSRGRRNTLQSLLSGGR